MRIKEQYSLWRFVGSLCVEEESLGELTRGQALKVGRQRTYSLRSPAMRQDSVMSLVRFDRGDWGRRDVVVIGAWRWNGGRVVRL